MKAGNAIIIVHFGELWLRGKNRGQYISTLMRNAREKLSGLGPTIELRYDRLVVTPKKTKDLEKIKEQLLHLFGISNFEVSYVTEPNLKSITALCKDLLKEKRNEFKVLRINSHRSYKAHKFNSIDIIESVARAAEKLGFKPHPRDYDSEIFINVTKDNAFASVEKTRALHGLPVGTSGKAVVLMSGGIDSPVAAFYAMKRGIVPVYLHLHGFAKNQEALRSKIPRIINILSKYHPHYKAYYVPTSLFQVKASKAGRFELVLLKAFMLKLAERVAEKENARLIYTGESLGQVASQTPGNLLAAQQGISLPILRPLIGFDKEEIITKARQIGTYEESIKEYRDVCSINARNPSTDSKSAIIGRLEKEIGMEKLVEASLKKATIVEK